MELQMFLILLFLLIPVVVFLTKKPTKKLPPGSMGLPLIGHSLTLLQAMRANKGEEWLNIRIKKYGSISKFNLFGKPTIFLSGQAANKFVYMSDSNTLANNQPASIRRIIGERNIIELSGVEHKRVRGALVSFLKPEVLKRYVGRIDEEVREHLKIHWHESNREEIIVEPLMKTLTFNVISSLIFGLGKGERRDLLKDIFKQMMEGMLSVPVNFPFTRFNRSLNARKKLEMILSDLIREKKEALQNNGNSSHQDLITCLLNMNKEGDNVLSDDEILDNISIIMIAGHDTTSILLTSLIRTFALQPSIYAAVAQEQEEIAKSKQPGELLTCDDLTKMKYTWRVALESLRILPPIYLSFRIAVRDIEYEGYVIPKGWQVVWSQAMTHMDENIFTNPTKFDDKRFEQQPPPHSFIAFGGGPRVCPGYEFAKMETLVLIHYLVTGFKWQLATDNSSYGRDPLPVFKNGLPIRVAPKTV